MSPCEVTWTRGQDGSSITAPAFAARAPLRKVGPRLMVTLANLGEWSLVIYFEGVSVKMFPKNMKTYHIMKRTKVMHWGLSAIRLLTSSSSSGVMGAAFRTTDKRFTCSAGSFSNMTCYSSITQTLDNIGLSSGNDINLPWRRSQEEGKWSPPVSILSSHDRRI